MDYRTRFYSYELIEHSQDGKPHFRIADKDDCRIATCYAEHNARFIVDALTRLATLDEEHKGR